jgi:hypothetical protein
MITSSNQENCQVANMRWFLREEDLTYFKDNTRIRHKHFYEFAFLFGCSDDGTLAHKLALMDFHSWMVLWLGVVIAEAIAIVVGR